MGLQTCAAIVGLLSGIIFVMIRYRSFHRFGEDGKIIMDAEFLENPGLPILVDLFARYGKPLANWYAPLEADVLLKKAQRRTGLEKFWAQDEDHWRKAFEMLLYSMNHEVDSWNALGIIGREQVVVEALENQLRVQDYIDNNPSVLDEEIKGPIVITGLPRTGSTHLQLSLCFSGQLNCLRYFESRFPVAPENLDKVTIGTELDPRVGEVETTVKMIHYLRPFFYMMHSWSPTSAFEEMSLTAMLMDSEFFLSNWQELPAYAQWFYNADHTPSFRFVKACLQIIQRQTGTSGRPWLLKSPQNSRMISAIRKVFPNAKFVMTHRKPTNVLKSLLPMLSYVSSIQRKYAPSKLASFWINAEKSRIDQALEAISQEQNLPMVHIDFERFMADQTGTIVKVLQYAGLSTSDEVVAAVKYYVEASPRKGANALNYNFEAFNTSAEEIDDIFQYYTKLKFPYI